MKVLTNHGATASRPVLVVEDDAGLSGLIVRALRKTGFEVTAASRGSEAIERVLIDASLVLLLDQSLPDMSGRDVIETLRARDREVPFIMMTGHGDERLAVEMMKLGAADYLVKDTELLDSLPHVLERLFRNLETERRLREAERELIESRERFQQVAFNASEWIWEVNRDGLFTYCSEAFEKILGYKVEEAVGKMCFYQLYPSEAREERRKAAFDLMAKRESMTGRLTENVHKGGGIVVLKSSAVPVYNHEGEFVGYRGLDVDVTAELRAEAEQAKLQAQLVQAQKMESMGRLAGGVAHDFNNMLQAILGNVCLVLGDLPSDSPLRDSLEEIQKSAQRSANLTRQLLAFARKQTVAPRCLDMNETVEGMLKILRRLIGENIELVWLPSKSPGFVKMDPSQIDQILANLCVNARDAIASVGKVNIETSTVTLTATEVFDRPDEAPGDYVKLVVSDNGCGMEEEVLSHLFEPFFTTKGIGKGTGLGLATVYGIVKQSGGFVRVQSQRGQGSVFQVYVPRCSAPTPLPSGAPPTSSAVRGRETVLLVEDEPAVLKVGKRGLESLGYTVLTASTPGMAIALAKQQDGPIHLLVTDLVMPEMNGKDLAGYLQSLYPGLKRLLMSGYAADVLSPHSVLDEGMHFIQKPFSMDSLAAKVRAVLDTP